MAHICRAIDVIKVIYLSDGEIDLIFHGHKLKKLNLKVSRIPLIDLPSRRFNSPKSSKLHGFKNVVKHKNCALKKAFRMNVVESLEQLSSASGKKSKKTKKQHFNDGMVDAGDREGKKRAHSTTGLTVAVMYNVLIFAYAWYTRNYLVMMLVVATWMV